ncbi:MAG: hypothetical protein WKG06_08590 [Segetibacter sp.]
MIVSNSSFSQNIKDARKWVDTLTSPYFWGRGYTKDGMSKAAQFIAQQFTLFGLKPLADKTFFQPFSYPVNTFPYDMQVSINGKYLDAGNRLYNLSRKPGCSCEGKFAATRQYSLC